MGQTEELFLAVIKKAVGGVKAQIFWGKATQINERTCTIVREGAPTIEDVLLNAIDSDLQTQFTVIPKENSHVLVGMIEGMPQLAAVLSCSEIDKIIVKTGSGGVSMNAGTGKIEIKNNAQNLKDILNETMTAIKAITVTAPPTGGATSTPINFAAFEVIEQKINLLLS